MNNLISIIFKNLIQIVSMLFCVATFFTLMNYIAPKKDVSLTKQSVVSATPVNVTAPVIVVPLPKEAVALPQSTLTMMPPPKALSLSDAITSPSVVQPLTTATVVITPDPPPVVPAVPIATPMPTPAPPVPTPAPISVDWLYTVPDPPVVTDPITTDVPTSFVLNEKPNPVIQPLTQVSAPVVTETSFAPVVNAAPTVSKTISATQNILPPLVSKSKITKAKPRKVVASVKTPIPVQPIYNSVTIYGASWCAPCHVLQNFLIAKRVAYNYIDIEKQAKIVPASVKTLTVKTGLPLVVYSDGSYDNGAKIISKVGK